MATSPPSDDRGAPAPIGTIVLVGMMGAGKSSVGSKLAGMLDRPYLDSDREIERITGSTVAQIFAASGEGVFRDLETRVLREALDRTDPVVVSAGGGVVLDDGNRQLLRAHEPVVWLRARVDTLVERVGTGQGRPLLDHDVVATITRLHAARRPLYEEVADLIVDVDAPVAAANDTIAGTTTDRETKVAETTATAARIVAALTHGGGTSSPSRSGVTFARPGAPKRRQNGETADGGAADGAGASGERP